MSGALGDLHVLVLDCQASGATPVLGDLLELGWGVSSATDNVHVPRAEWIVPGSSRRISRIVRELTGWSESCLELGVDPLDAWQRVRDVAPGAAVPTVIHFARFELAFLRDLHARTGEGEFPLDAVCVHAAAERIFPDLPRRNLRALAGHLGHSADLIRRASGHVEATAFIWRALLPHLAERGVTTWSELKAWLAEPLVRAARKKRVFPMPSSVRRALPDAPGVYRFLRPNGDVLYVGKATSLRKRVASHFSAGQRTTERALEMLSQAHSIDATPTATILEAALLETDEIKRIDPPYNVQLRGGERSAWFASTDWSHAVAAPDDTHRVGPLPSRYALSSAAAVRALLEGAERTDRVRAAAVDTVPKDAPDAEAFDRVWNAFAAGHLGGAGSARSRILAAGQRLPLPESPPDAPPGWDDARILRHLQRAVVAGATLVRRARLLGLLAYATVRFHEVGAAPRELALHGATLVPEVPARLPSRAERLATFDAHKYDRVRILATELRRVAAQGGAVEVRVAGRLVRDVGGSGLREPADEPLGEVDAGIQLDVVDVGPGVGGVVVVARRADGGIDAG